MSDKCQLPDPKNPARGCGLVAAHKGKHYAGGFWWDDKTPTKRTAPAKSTSAAKAPTPKKAAKPKPAKKSKERAPEDRLARSSEELAKTGYCGALFGNAQQGQADVCTRIAGHPGAHANTSTGTTEAPSPEDADAEAVAAADADAAARANLDAVDDDDEDDPLEDEIRSDEERDFARQQREAREAHARELEQGDSNAAPEPTAAHSSSVAASGDRILGYRSHVVAPLFPLIEGDDFEQFADLIKANGLRDPIELVRVGGEDLILDGRNRARACEARGIKPKFRHYEGPKDLESLKAYSMDKNGKGRRHLGPSILAMIADEAAQLGRGNPGDRETGRSAGLMTQAEAGKKLGISERLVRRARVVREKGTAKLNEAVKKGKLAVEAAELVTKLPKAKQDEIAAEALSKKSGEVKSGRVRSLVKQEEKRSVVRKINEQRVAPAPLGPFGLIVIDPPWPYENSDQHEGSRGHIDYPPMPIEAICELRVDLDARAKPDCVLGMWITNAFVHEIGRILAAWGFQHRTMYTWDKELEGIGMWGRGRTEHLVIASRGEPVHTLNEISTLMTARRREHSRKPDEVYALLAKHCAGPMLDMFAREPREGFSTWGAEPRKFEAA